MQIDSPRHYVACFTNFFAVQWPIKSRRITWNFMYPGCQAAMLTIALLADCAILRSQPLKFSASAERHGEGNLLAQIPCLSLEGV